MSSRYDKAPSCVCLVLFWLITHISKWTSIFIPLRGKNAGSRKNIPYSKIVAVRDVITPWIDEHGVQYISIEDFLLGRTGEL